MPDLRQILDTLDTHSLSYVMARQSAPDRVSAFRQAGVTKDWFYDLPKDEQRRLDDLADLMRRDVIMQMDQKLRERLPEAVDKLIDLALNGKRESVQFQALVELMDRVAGPVTRKQSVDMTSGGEAIDFQPTPVDYRGAIAALAPGPVPDRDSSGED